MKIKKSQLRELVKVKMLEILKGLNETRSEKALKMLADRLKVDVDQLRMGIKIEYEHTKDFVVAAKIALDHLREIPDYYTKLDKMEKGAKNEISTTAGAAGFETPKAFKKTKWDKKKLPRPVAEGKGAFSGKSKLNKLHRNKLARQAGMTIVREDSEADDL